MSRIPAEGVLNKSDKPPGGRPRLGYNFGMKTSNVLRVAGGHVAMRAPRLSLAACVRGHITRSTLDAPPMSDAQRLNHFPGTPHCAITWFTAGALARAGFAGSELQVPAARVYFSGPFSQPSWSLNPGPVDVYMLVLMPGVMHLLTGIDVDRYTDRLVDFNEVADARWGAMARAVLDAPGHDSRIALVEEFLEPRWQAARARNGLRTEWFRDCLTGLALRAVTSDWMHSSRQLERRIKTWTGLPLRRLRGLERGERAFHEAYAALQAGTLCWPDVAGAAGFADQAHLCRETRKNTGLTATELRWAVENQESYWMYRAVLGERS